MTIMANINEVLLSVYKIWMVVMNQVCSVSELFRQVSTFYDIDTMKQQAQGKGQELTGRENHLKVSRAEPARVCLRVKIHNKINMLNFPSFGWNEKRNQTNSLDDVHIPALHRHNRCTNFK